MALMPVKHSPLPARTVSIRAMDTTTIASWNVNSLNVRLPHLEEWLKLRQPDIVGLQETKLEDPRFPDSVLAGLGYRSVFCGQKTYNGVAILSRHPLRDVVRNIPGFGDEQARVIAATLDTPAGPLRLLNGYFVNGQEPGSEKFAYKMRWLQALQDMVRAEMAAHPRLVLVGDFNVAPEDRDSYDPVGLKDTIHCTVQEREKLQALIGLGLTDSFRLFEQPEKSYSWWDYREFAFRRNRGLRIDHILISQALKARASACVIDRAPRKNERPSDHAPVVLTLG